MIEIITADRIDYCGVCKKEHGYDCPLDKKTLREEIMEELIKNNK